MRSPEQRGAALLVVLSTLVLVATSSAALLRLASMTHLRRVTTEQARVAEDLAHALEAPIASWLESDSMSVVLPLDASVPGVSVLHEVLVLDGRECEVQVTAFDQCGMVPIELARSGSPLRLALSDPIRTLLDRVSISRDDIVGLDCFALRESQRSGEPAIFPMPLDDEDSKSSELGTLSESFGAVVATHGPGAINVATAPIELVEQAMRVAGRGDLDRVLAAREAGEPFGMPSESRPRDRRERPDVSIETTSSAWSMRIDVRVGAVRQSWWSIFRRVSGSWECVQRLAINE